MIQPQEIASRILLENEASFKIFFWGLNKNAGKTTTLLYTYKLLKKLTQRPIVLLSCGFDGEDMDAITGLPKPEIEIQKGDYCITTSNVVNTNFKLIKTYNYKTTFGNAVLLKANLASKIPLISIGTTEIISSCIENTILPKDTIFLFDGAINRKSFLSMATENDYISISVNSRSSNSIEEQLSALQFIHSLFCANTKMEYSNCPILHSENYKSFKNSTIILPNIASCFINEKEYKQFIQNGNKLHFNEKPLSILWFSYNPFDANTNLLNDDLSNNLADMLNWKNLFNLQALNNVAVTN